MRRDKIHISTGSGPQRERERERERVRQRERERTHLVEGKLSGKQRSRNFSFEHSTSSGCPAGIVHCKESIALSDKNAVLRKQKEAVMCIVLYW